ncbi:hypothetical protein MMC29_000492 [Sticta canariensis]|nr:hypothetical protein [Sticta canariensis]
MATFAVLPPEIHDAIAEICQNKDLISLCCTSKWVKELYVRVLYRHVDLRPETYNSIFKRDERKWQARFFQSLLTHPEYAMNVRYFRPVLHTRRIRKSEKPMISDKDMWRAMESLTNVQTVDIGSRNDMAYCRMVPTKQLPKDLFHSATSVTLVGRMPSRLAKSILDAVNPATLKYLCLDLVQEWDPGHTPHTYMPGEKDEDGRIIAHGTISGLLTTLTGCCTKLQTLILRRVGQTHIRLGWHVVAEEQSHVEWASFISSVQGTVEKFTFELAGEMEGGWLPGQYTAIDPGLFRIADKRFRRLILPAIIAGNWPCLNIMELKGIRSPDGQAGTAALIAELTALLGGNAKIVVEEDSCCFEEEYYPEEIMTELSSSDESESEMSESLSS